MILTQEQARITAHPGGPAIVLAGAGSGKTTTIIQWISAMIRAGENPRDFLVLTFSKRGAADMKRRARSFGLHWAVQFRTLHSVAKQIVEQSYPTDRKLESPVKEYKQREVVKFAIRKFKEERELGQDDVKGLPRPGRILGLIGTLKARLVWPDLYDFGSGEIVTPGAWSSVDGEDYPSAQELADDCLDEEDALHFDLLAYCYTRLELASQEPDRWTRFKDSEGKRWVSFDDMVALTARAILQGDEWIQGWKGRWKHVVIDEAQDNAIGNWVMCQHLCRGGNLMAVGDDQQSIYSFRAARPDLMADYLDRAKPEVYTLTTNFRSGEEIVEGANNLLTYAESRLSEKPCVSGLSIKGQYARRAYMTARDEASGIVSQIEELIECGVGMEQIAVLYRTRACSGELELEMIRRRLDYKISGHSIFRRGPVRAALGFVGVALDGTNRASFRDCYNVPNRYLGNAFLERFPSYQEAEVAELSGELGRWDRGFSSLKLVVESTRTTLAEHGLVKAVERLLYKHGIKEFFETDEDDEDDEDVEEMCEFLVNCCASTDSPEGLLDYVRKTTGHDDPKGAYDPSWCAPRVTLSTAHAAKGLEWGFVFLARMEEGLFPHQLGDLEEERRLAYVAVTRAKNLCSISWTSTRETKKGTMRVEPSSFLAELKRPRS